MALCHQMAANSAVSDREQVCANLKRRLQRIPHTLLIHAMMAVRRAVLDCANSFHTVLFSSFINGVLSSDLSKSSCACVAQGVQACTWPASLGGQAEVGCQGKAQAILLTAHVLISVFCQQSSSLTESSQQNNDLVVS